MVRRGLEGRESTKTVRMRLRGGLTRFELVVSNFHNQGTYTFFVSWEYSHTLRRVYIGVKMVTRGFRCLTTVVPLAYGFLSGTVHILVESGGIHEYPLIYLVRNPLALE